MPGPRICSRRSSRARSTYGQEIYRGLGTVQKSPSGVSWVDLSRDRYMALPVSHPCRKYICSRAIVHLRQTRIVQANYILVQASKCEKKETCKRRCLHFAIFLTLGKFQFSKRKSLIDHDDSDNINNKHQFYRLAKRQLGMCIIPSHLT